MTLIRDNLTPLQNQVIIKTEALEVTDEECVPIKSVFPRPLPAIKKTKMYFEELQLYFDQVQFYLNPNQEDKVLLPIEDGIPIPSQLIGLSNTLNNLVTDLCVENVALCDMVKKSNLMYRINVN